MNVFTCSVCAESGNWRQRRHNRMHHNKLSIMFDGAIVPKYFSQRLGSVRSRFLQYMPYLVVRKSGISRSLVQRTFRSKKVDLKEKENGSSIIAPSIVSWRGCWRKVRRICIISITCYSLINPTSLLFYYRWIMKQNRHRRYQMTIALLQIKFIIFQCSMKLEMQECQSAERRWLWKQWVDYCLCSVQSPQLCSKHWICT